MDAKLAAVGVGCVVGTVIVVGVSALMAWIVSILYNGILVPTFGFPPLTFGQCWGIIVLINLVFGGLRSVSTSSK